MGGSLVSSLRNDHVTEAVNLRSYLATLQQQQELLQSVLKKTAIRKTFRKDDLTNFLGYRFVDDGPGGKHFYMNFLSAAKSAISSEEERSLLFFDHIKDYFLLILWKMFEDNNQKLASQVIRAKSKMKELHWNEELEETIHNSCVSSAKSPSREEEDDEDFPSAMEGLEVSTEDQEQFNSLARLFNSFLSFLLEKEQKEFASYLGQSRRFLHNQMLISFPPLFDHVKLPLLILSNDRSLLYANPAFRSLTQFSAQEITAGTLKMFYCRKTEPELIEELHSSLEKGVGKKLFMTNAKKDGTIFYNCVNVTPIYEAKYYSKCVLTFYDITKPATSLSELRETEQLSLLIAASLPLTANF
jgi:transcriptional regulator with PAS, ATPase and Fis domain